MPALGDTVLRRSGAAAKRQESVVMHEKVLRDNKLLRACIWVQPTQHMPLFPCVGSAFPTMSDRANAIQTLTF